MAEFTVSGPGGEATPAKDVKEEKQEPGGCPFYLNGRCGYLERPIESMLGEGGEGAGEEDEEESDED